MSDEPFYIPNRKPAPPRQPRPGLEIWRLRDRAGHIKMCELRNDERVGAGWDVQFFEDGEPLFSGALSHRSARARGRRDGAAGVAQDGIDGHVDGEGNARKKVHR